MNEEKCIILGKEYRRYQYSLLLLCDFLHMYCNGNIEVYEPITPYVAKKYLEWRLENWRKKTYSKGCFNILVKITIEYILSKCEKCKWFPNIEEVSNYMKNYNCENLPDLEYQLKIIAIK